MTCGIYKITNLDTGKYYIGQSVNIERRWKDHRTKYKMKGSNQYNSHFYRAMRKYSSWDFSILEECTEKKLDEEEKFWIKALRAYDPDFGYNETMGGESGHPNKITEEQAREIVNLLKNTKLSQTEIANKYNVSQYMVSLINKGDNWTFEKEIYPIRSRNYMGRQHYYCAICGKEITHKAKYCVECAHKLQQKVEHPSREQLKQEIRINTFTILGRKYGVADNTIRKWCKGYDLPYRTKDILNYSDEEWNKI